MTWSAHIAHHVPKCMSYQEVIGEWAITGRAHFDYIYFLYTYYTFHKHINKNYIHTRIKNEDKGANGRQR